MRVEAAGQSADFSFDTTGKTLQNMGWQNFSWEFIATSSQTKLEFYSLSTESTNANYGLVLDNISVKALTVAPANVTVKVEDGRGGFDTQSFVIELADRNVDLTIANIQTENLVVDGQLLTVSAQVSAQIGNQGLNALTEPFKVVFFEDRNINQAYDTGIDTVLREVQVTTPLQASQSTTITTNLSGFLSFVNSPIWAFVDAEKVIFETNENNNLAFSSQDCIAQRVGEFNPVVEWNKNTFSVLPSSNQVMMTPAVIDLNDDDIPDIVFSTFIGANYVIDGNLRAISGADGSELWTITNPSYEVQGASGVAVGDIENDGKPEIVAVAESGEALIAFEHDGTFKWRSPNFWTGFPNRGGISQWGSASLADLNQDSTPEIIVGSTVLNNQGQILWRGTSVGGLGQGDNNVGALSVVADLDLDGSPEVIAGKSAFRANGSLYWNASINDGFPAIGNFDSDPNPEIVVVSQGKVYLLEHTGQIKWGGISIPGGGQGGAPTIADVDGDGQPEIGVAGANRYVVLETDGSVKWTSDTRDNSSTVTGSSVFDFDGDGKAEIVYGDELFLRIYNGIDGRILYQLPKGSGTTYELPLIVDVDADGNAEIVAIANNYAFGAQTGIFVIGDLNDTWVSTRQIWNQHSYHITNINDDGSIPIREENSWQTHNTYRLNLQTHYNPLAAPDLTASYLRTEEVAGKTTIKARIGNGGSIFVAAGVSVAFYQGDPQAGGVLLGTTKTTKKLEIGAFEDVSLTVNSTSLQNIWVVADDDGTGKGQVNECEENNNRYSEVFVNGRGEIRGTKWEDLNGDGIRNNLIADSVAEFSGVQGQNNWYYGYYDGPFTSSGFQQMTQFEIGKTPPLAETVPNWWVDEKTLWTLIAADGTHPNGVITSFGRTPVEHWSVRRWVSEVEGEIEISGKLAKSPGQIGGNGVIGRILVDGIEIWSQAIANTQGINYKIKTTVKAGSVVDFAVNPNASNDLVDSTVFTATLTHTEPGLAGVTVYLDRNNNSLLDADEPTQITASDNPNTLDIDETGQYRFTNLAPDTYIVREVVPGGYKQTFPVLSGTKTINFDSIKGMANTPQAIIPVNSQLSNQSLLSDGVIFSSESPYIAIVDITTNDIQPDNHTSSPLNAIRGATIDGKMSYSSPIVGRFFLPSNPSVKAVTNFVSIETDRRGAGTPVKLEVFDLRGNLIGSMSAPDINGPTLSISVAGIHSFRITGNGTSGFDDLTFSSLTSDFYTIQIEAEQIVENINFGNTKTNEIQPNQSPIFTSTAPTTAQIGQLLRYNSIAVDPDSDRLTFDLPLKPEGMVVDETTGILAWQPTSDQVGIHDVILRVQDGRGGISLQTFQLNVTALNNIPSITSTPLLKAVAGRTYQYQVKAQDADGDTLTYSLKTPPTGVILNATTGILTWTPTTAQIGNQTITLTANDSKGGEATQSFTLEVVATAPNSNPQITSTPRTTISLGSSYFYNLETLDPDSDPLTFTLEEAPAGMTINNQAIIRWEPQSNQFGINSVRIKVEDGRGGIAIQEFNIEVVNRVANQSPQITSTPSFTATANRVYQYNLTGNDPDGDLILWNLVTQPEGMSINPDQGTIRWQPTINQIGTHTVTVQVLDTQGATATQTFTLAVNGVNLPPSIISTPSTRTTTNQPYTYTVVATDPENSPLTYSLGLKPNGMTVDATGKVQWISNQTGTYDIDVLVKDAQGATTTQTYQLVVGTNAINQAPTITSTPNFVATLGSTYRYQVQANDPDSQTLTYRLLEAPSGATLNASSGLLQWTNPIAGNYQVVVAAFDTEGLGVTQRYTLTAKANGLPIIRSTPPLQATPDSLYRYDIQAFDPDGDTLAYSLNAEAIAKGITLDGNGRLTWTPSISQVGTHAVTLTVTDNAGGNVTQNYNLIVAADTTAPKVTINRSTNILNKGETVSFQVAATDNVGVANLRLFINNNPISIDSLGVATFTATNIGVITARAIASDLAGNNAETTTTVNVLDPTDTEAPSVSLDLSGISNFEITAPTEIRGSVNDTNLAYYALEVAPVDGSAPFKEMFRGTKLVNNGVLGVLDPSLLPNDSYQVRLVAYDVNGKGNGVTELLDVKGDLKLGNFQISFTDLEIPVGGIPITLTRTYDSLYGNTRDDFCFGWRMEFRDADVRTSLRKDELYEEYGIRGVGFKEGDSVYLTLPSGKRERFTFKLEPINAVVNNFLGRNGLYNPTFVADDGVTSTLSVATQGVVLIRGQDGQIVPFSGGSAFAHYHPIDWGNYYQLTTKEGIVYNIDATTDDINAITNRNGDQLTFTEAGITNSNGQQVAFGRDAQGRIVTVTDLMGHQIKYEYNANGDLVKVIDRENNATQFEYNTTQPHHLEEIIDPLGRTGIRNKYDENGRLTKVFNADGEAVQLEYNPDNFVYTIKDALGNPTTYEYDARGNVITEIDALGGITRRTYDEDNNLLSETNPEGEKITYTYDSKGNKLTETDALETLLATPTTPLMTY